MKFSAASALAAISLVSSTVLAVPTFNHAKCALKYASVSAFYDAADRITPGTVETAVVDNTKFFESIDEVNKALAEKVFTAQTTTTCPYGVATFAFYIQGDNESEFPKDHAYKIVVKRNSGLKELSHTFVPNDQCPYSSEVLRLRNYHDIASNLEVKVVEIDASGAELPTPSAKKFKLGAALKCFTTTPGSGHYADGLNLFNDYFPKNGISKYYYPPTEAAFFIDDKSGDSSLDKFVTSYTQIARSIEDGIKAHTLDTNLCPTGGLDISLGMVSTVAEGFAEPDFQGHTTVFTLSIGTGDQLKSFVKTAHSSYGHLNFKGSFPIENFNAIKDTVVVKLVENDEDGNELVYPSPYFHKYRFVTRCLPLNIPKACTDNFADEARFYSAAERKVAVPTGVDPTDIFHTTESTTVLAEEISTALKALKLTSYCPSGHLEFAFGVASIDQSIPDDHHYKLAVSFKKDGDAQPTIVSLESPKGEDCMLATASNTIPDFDTQTVEDVTFAEIDESDTPLDQGTSDVFKYFFTARCKPAVYSQTCIDELIHTETFHSAEDTLGPRFVSHLATANNIFNVASNQVPSLSTLKSTIHTQILSPQIPAICETMSYIVKIVPNTGGIQTGNTIKFAVESKQTTPVQTIIAADITPADGCSTVLKFDIPNFQATRAAGVITTLLDEYDAQGAVVNTLKSATYKFGITGVCSKITTIVEAGEEALPSPSNTGSAFSGVMAALSMTSLAAILMI